MAELKTSEAEVFAALAAWNRLMGYSRQERMREALRAAELMRGEPLLPASPPSTTLVRRMIEHIRDNLGYVPD